MIDGEKVEGNKRRAAVLVGISRYKNSKFNLKGCTNDVEEIYRRLVGSEALNYEIPEDHYLLDEAATAQAIRKALGDVLYKPDRYELVLFYFSGHGIRDLQGNGWLLAHDTEISNAFGTAINMSDISSVVSNSKNKEHVIAILDCCYSGIATEGAKDPEGTLLHNEQNAINQIQDELKKGATKENRIIVSSSKGDEQSIEEEFTHKEGVKHYHGLFSGHLIEGLDNENLSSSTLDISFKNLMQYVADEIKKKNKQIPKCYFGGLDLSDYVSAPEIKIAVARGYSTNRDNVLKSAAHILADNPNQRNIHELCVCSGRLYQILRYQPNLTDAIRIKQDIDTYISTECSTVMLRWYQRHKAIILQDQEIRQVKIKTREEEKFFITQLEELLPSLNFDYLVSICNSEFITHVLENLYSIAIKWNAGSLSEDAQGARAFIRWAKVCRDVYLPRIQDVGKTVGERGI
jgi:hypothetical protein